MDGYIIDVYPPHGQIKSPVLQKNGEVVEDPTQPRRVVTGLVPGEAYNFTVKSTSGREISDQEVLETRIPPETPGEIETVEVGSRSAILDWQKEHRGYLDGFYIETSPPDGEVANPRDSSEKQRELVGLKPGKRYGVKVHSTAYGLLSFKPSERSIITLPEAPLGDLIVISQNPVNVTLSVSTYFHENKCEPGAVRIIISLDLTSITHLGELYLLVFFFKLPHHHNCRKAGCQYLLYLIMSS